MDWLAMLQFSIGAGAVLGLGVWLLYFIYVRPAVSARKQNLQRLVETSMSTQEEVQMLTAFRVLPEERKVIAIKLIEALR